MAVPKILVTNKIRQCGIDFLQEHGFELLWSKSNSVEDVRKIACACDGIIARMTPVKQTLIDAAPNLKIIGMHGVGLDGIDIPYATQKGIAVTHTPAANCISVAEHAMGAILNLSKKTIPADKALREEHRFQDRDLFIGHDIQGKILGIVGLGRIGRQLAQMAGLGFGMKVIAYDPYVPEKEMSQVGAGVEKKSTLEEIMAVSDFISFHVQLTPETTGMVNYDLLKLMKPTAYFINEMRGALVVESDLCRALREGIIAGAAVASCAIVFACIGLGGRKTL